ncbi:MAG: hypothetical protein FJW23_09880 [Acidimicrobiia bacterium]|nr:hypothetical protein [Acidimicrobiia bacterium]
MEFAGTTIVIPSHVMEAEHPDWKRQRDLTDTARAIDRRWTKAHKWAVWMPRHLAFLVAFRPRRVHGRPAPPPRQAPFA